MKTVLIAGALVGVATVAVFATGKSDMERVGYFKSDDRNRVMAYVAADGMSEVDAHTFLSSVMHTDGKLTFAVVYTDDRHPGHTLTGAPDYLTAVDILEQPQFDGWSWGVVITPRGEVKKLR